MGVLGQTMDLLCTRSTQKCPVARTIFPSEVSVAQETRESKINGCASKPVQFSTEKEGARDQQMLQLSVASTRSIAEVGRMTLQ